MFLTEADLFIARMNVSDREKLFRKIYQAERVRDPALFKKLSNEIWNFVFGWTTFGYGYWLFGISGSLQKRWL